MDAAYATALRELGIEKYLALRTPANTSDLLVEYTLKAIFYSNGASDPHNKSMASLIADGNISVKEGILPDSILRSRVYKIVQKLNEMGKNGITVDSVVDLRATLIEEILFPPCLHHTQLTELINIGVIQ